MNAPGFFPARLVAAATIALVALGATPAAAQTAPVPVGPVNPGAVEGGTLIPAIPFRDPARDPEDRPERGPVEEPKLVFGKIGKQESCEAVTYWFGFGLRAEPDYFAHPSLQKALGELRLDFRDQMPAGLEIIDVRISGDVTGAGGSAVPAHVLSTTATTNDTLAISDLRLSPHDLDGLRPYGRFLEVSVTARIDPTAFPAPATVENQATVTATAPGGTTLAYPSHDPLVPDDDDPTTGAPTKVAIDLTECDGPPPPPPPPPGDDPVQACFRVETGTIDCTKGGAAFIYNMDVGADMAGNVVQLRAATPGISISPASQTVPDGGGTLSWTITGASPGDVVRLIVVGVETHAYDGLAEGVGICCTQVVDLAIPEDIDCPDRDREPDIRVEKKADVASCTPEGGCDFTITVANAGDAPYSGKIVLEEVTTPAGAEVVSGPNAPWSCAPGTTPMLCEHPETTLPPGASIELRLGFKPTLAAAKLGAIRNCAEYDYAASGKQPFGDAGNDKACAAIPICVPGRDRACTPQQEPRVDLTIRKVATPASCTADGVCRFVVTVINSGSVPYSGPLTVIDEFPIHPPASVEFLPAPPWSCTAESGSRFSCEHPAVTLAPGASIPLGVRAIVADHPGHRVENCAEVVPVASESDLTNNKACAVATLPRRPDEPQCAPGFVINEAGLCVCPEGTGFRNGRCAGEETTTPALTPRPTPPAATPQCRLLPGQVRTRDGRCVCPRGTTLRNGRCVQTATPPPQRDPTPPPPRQCTLLPGQVRTPDGRCVCPRGTTLRNGRCVQTATPPPQRDPAPRVCPPGMTGRPPDCRPERSRTPDFRPLPPRPPETRRPDIRNVPGLNQRLRNDPNQNVIR